jgi:SAM-dependent methyltransferase
MGSIVQGSKALIKRLVRLSGISATSYKLTHSSKAPFVCPICGYRGPFRDVSAETGLRRHAKCPACGALERHRLQFVVMKDLAKKQTFKGMSCLHFAPETFFRSFFKEWFGTYTTADLLDPDVDHNVDLTKLPFPDRSFDCVYASHVLEHISDDRKALSEIRRVLKPGGLAILPVPFVGHVTVEYPEPNPHEAGHVRAPGFDYVERYKEYFDSVEEFGSQDYPLDYQLYIFEDRSGWPTPTMPLRAPMSGEKHVDLVPVCRVQSE